MIGIPEIIQTIVSFISLYYIVFWILVLLEGDESIERKSHMKKTPTVSILVPAYNEEKSIALTLKSIKELDYKKKCIKIIFINDGSKDKTYKKAERFLNPLKKANLYNGIILLNQKNSGKHSALNNGLKYCDTDFVATLDADSYPQKDALKKIISCFYDKEIAAVSSVVRIYKPANFLQSIQRFEYILNHYLKSILSKLNAIHVLPGPLSVYRTEIVKEMDGFREAHKTEDMDIAMRMHQKKYKIIQCNCSFVYTTAPYTLKELFVQRHRWNYGTFKNLFDYRKMIFNKKFGDFGVFQMPMIFASGVLGITTLSLLLFDSWKQAKPQFKLLSLYNFNIIEYIKSMTVNFIWLDIDAKTIVIFSFFLVINIIVMIIAMRSYRERYILKSTLSLIGFMFFYYLFLSFVWLVVFRDMIIGKETGWKK
ncbi:MAG: glycosyltransferase family 2 protein [archaeon]